MWSWLKSNQPTVAVQPSMRHYTPHADKQLQGAQAEQMACAYLQNQGLRLLDANVACEQGEIDLVMLDHQTLVFVEVRWRKNAAYGGAMASITPAKLRRLSTACEIFLQHNPAWRAAPCRIDAVLLQGALTAPDIVWLNNITG